MRMAVVAISAWALFGGTILNPVEVPETGKAVDAIRSVDAQERAEAKRLIASNRQTLIRALIDVVVEKAGEDDQWAFGSSQVKDVIEILGEVRAAEAVDLLCEHIGKDDVGKEGGPGVVVRALVKIGNPSIPPVLERIRTAEDSEVIWSCAQVIKGVDGKPIGKYRLMKLINEATGMREARSLRQALKYL